MTTVELEPDIDETVDSEEHTPHEFCHLYVRRGIAMCGLPHDRDPHRRTHGNTRIYWEKGMTACPICGMAICLECLLAAG